MPGRSSRFRSTRRCRRLRARSRTYEQSTDPRKPPDHARAASNRGPFFMCTKRPCELHVHYRISGSCIGRSAIRPAQTGAFRVSSTRAQGPDVDPERPRQRLQPAWPTSAPIRCRTTYTAQKH